MRTNPTSYYELLSFGLGSDPKAWQTFVDKFNLKYNKLEVDGFSWDNEIQLDYTYEQLQTSLGIATLPIYVDAESEALDKKLGGFSIGSNKIPTQKHRYPINTRILREKMILAQKFGNSVLNADTKNAIMELLFESTDKLIMGNRNALTHQRMRVVSTGKFVIGVDNNPRGLQGITFDFGITATTALTNDNRWWTNASHVATYEGSTSDPIEDMKKVIKAKRKAGWPTLHIEMTQDLLDDLYTHSKVLERIGLASNAAISTDAAKILAANMDDDAKLSRMERIIGARIIARDSVSRVEKFDTTTKNLVFDTVENFAKTNIAFVPDGEIGTIKSVQQLVLDDPTARYAWFDGGRTLISQRYDAKTRAAYIESEGAWLTVPNVSQYMTYQVVTV